jgi:hypothetical protein
VFSAVVVLVAVLFGSHLLRLWWPLTPSTGLTPSAVGTEGLSQFDDPSMPREIELGDVQMVVYRQEVAGRRRDATARLCEECTSQLRESALPSGEASEAEQALLKFLATRRPIDKPTADSALYQLDKSLPIVVGTRSVAAEDDERANDDAQGRRIVVWGLLVPRRPTAWHLYCFRTTPAAGHVAPGDNGEVEVPVPPSADHVLTIRSTGTVVATFRGTSPEEWSTFYDGWFRGRGATATVAWRHDADQWHSRWVWVSGGVAHTADLHFSRAVDVRGDGPVWRGVLTEVWERGQ